MSRIQTYLLSAAIASIIGGIAIAQPMPKCFFLECEGGQRSEPGPPPVVPSTPAAAAPAAPQAKAAIPPRKGLPRPKAAGEVCERAANYTYCASSVLKPQIDNDRQLTTYGPANVVDGRLETAWVEGKTGNGEGDWLIVDFGAPRRLTGIEIYNGYHKNASLFQRNNRIRDVEIVLSDATILSRTLNDAPGPQSIMLAKETTADWVQIKIVSVYPGSRYKDTAITELRILGNP